MSAALDEMIGSGLVRLTETLHASESVADDHGSDDWARRQFISQLPKGRKGTFPVAPIPQPSPPRGTSDRALGRYDRRLGIEFGG